LRAPWKQIKPPAAHGRRSLLGAAAALRPPEPTAPVHTCPVGPQTSSGIVIARFGRSQELSVASRGAGEAPTPAGPVFEAPRRRDATDWHGKARRARHGRSASRAARATPSVACSSGLSRPPCCLDRALDPVAPSIDPRGAAVAGGYTSARSAHRVDAGRAPPAFEPEPGGSVCPVPPPLPSHLTVTRRRRSPPPAPAAPRAARARSLGGTLARATSSVCRPPGLSCAREPQPHRQPVQGSPLPSVLLSGLLAARCLDLRLALGPRHLSCCASSHRKRGRHEARRVSTRSRSCV